HPLAWWVNREVELSRESACDDVVISHVPARVFAQDLFSIAAGDRVEKVGLAMGMGLGRKSAVQQRIRALFGRAPHRVEVRLSERLMMIGGGALLLSSSVMTGCQATHSITMEGPPPGPRQMQFVATLNPRFSDTTVVSSSSPLPGERHLRFTINETSTLIKEGNREFLNTLPAPLPDLWSKPIAIRSGSSFNAKVKMTFSGHRILNAREAKEFLSMSGVMP